MNSLPEGVDTTIPNISRMYDYALGGKDNFAVDRAAMDQLYSVVPYGPRPAFENRAFLRRAVTRLCEAGIQQFIDLGSGLPTRGNVHEVAQEIIPDARVVYVDYDPVAVTHANALLATTGNVAAVQADIRHPRSILDDERVNALIDLDRPTAVLMVAILHSLTDDEDPYGLVGQYRAALAPGSHLVLSHITSHGQPTEIVESLVAVFDQAREPMVPRSREEILRFFDGLELVDPGLIVAPEWRPETVDTGDVTGLVLAGVGRKS